MLCGNITVEQYDFMLKNNILKYICNNCFILQKPCNIQEEIRVGFAALTASLEKEIEKKKKEESKKIEESEGNRG